VDEGVALKELKLLIHNDLETREVTAGEAFAGA
jgi:hypothetical protein